MKEVQLFVDCMIPKGKNEAPENSRKAVEFIERVLPSIGAILYVHVIPIKTFGDKEKLVTNGITKLPALLDNQRTFVGLDSIRANVNKHINGKRSSKKDDTDILREEQMAEMDMDKYENGEYDDDDGDDDDVFRKGDKDAQKENIQQKIAQFNSRRKGRTEDSKPSKRGSKKKKPTRHRQQPNDDDEPDNVEVAERPRRGDADLKMEDWDPETQQLLDKAGN